MHARITSSNTETEAEMAHIIARVDELRDSAMLDRIERDVSKEKESETERCMQDMRTAVQGLLVLTILRTIHDAEILVMFLLLPSSLEMRVFRADIEQQLSIERNVVRELIAETKTTSKQMLDQLQVCLSSGISI